MLDAHLDFYAHMTDLKGRANQTRKLLQERLISPSQDRLRFVHLVLLNLGRNSVRDVRKVTYAVQDLTRIRVLLDNSFKSLEIILEKSVGKVLNTISFGTINVKIVQLVINVVLLHLSRFHVKTKVITVTRGR